MKITAILFFLVLIGFTQAQEKRNIGLVPFSNTSGNIKNDWVSNGFEYYLSNKLSVISGFFISDPAIFKKALNEAGYGKRPLDERMVYHIGKYAQVEVVLSGSYTVKDNYIVLDVVFSNAFNGSKLIQSRFKEPLNNFFKIGKEIVDQLINLAGITLSPAEEDLLNLNMTRSLRAYESFVKAYMENEKKNPRLEQVTGLFRKAIREDSRFWEAYYNLGIVYFNAKSYGNALTQFNKVITALPNFDKPYYGRGLIYFKQKSYNEAISDFEKVTEFNPNDYKPFYYLGKISLLKKNYPDVMRHLTKAIELNPEFAASYFEMGNSFFTRGMFRKSIDYYKKAVHYDAKNAKYHLKLADVYYRSQVFYNALNHVNLSLDLDSSNPSAHFLKGVTIYKQAVIEELIDAFLELLTAESSIDPLAENTLDRETQMDPVKKKQVYIDMAIAFTEAISFNPKFTEAYFNLALTFHEMGKLEDAEKYYIKTMRLKPNLLRPYLKLADLYTKTNRKTMAIDQYRRAFYIEPSVFVNHPTLGREHHYINIMERFREELDYKLKKNPRDTEANLVLAKVFQAQGEFGKAANLARKVLTQSPNNNKAKHLLAQVSKNKMN